MNKRFNVGDLIAVGIVRRRKLAARKMVSGWRRPPDNSFRQETDIHFGKLGIVTQYFHFNQFWKGTETQPSDSVYVCYMQEDGEYYILCIDEIHKPEEVYPKE